MYLVFVIVFVELLSISNCQSPQVISFNASAMLESHNTIRANANEPPLQYDGNLSALALLKAQICSFQHNDMVWLALTYAALKGETKNASTLLPEDYIGENLFSEAPGSLSINPISMAQGWYNEIQAWNCLTGACIPFGSITECLHYTQIVNLQTTLVGCAYVLCNMSTSPFTPQTQWNYLVCEYTYLQDQRPFPTTDCVCRTNAQDTTKMYCGSPESRIPTFLYLVCVFLIVTVT